MYKTAKRLTLSETKNKEYKKMTSRKQYTTLYQWFTQYYIPLSQTHFGQLNRCGRLSGSASVQWVWYHTSQLSQHIHWHDKPDTWQTGHSASSSSVVLFDSSLSVTSATSFTRLVDTHAFFLIISSSFFLFFLHCFFLARTPVSSFCGNLAIILSPVLTVCFIVFFFL